MDWEFYLVWLSVMAPLIWSPGPANIAVAALASDRGFRGALGFILGIQAVNLLVVTTVGLGFGALHAKYDSFFHIIEIVGAVYIFYLAYRLWASSAGDDEAMSTEKLSFKSGVALQALNAKLYPVIAMMFTQFLDSHKSSWQEAMRISMAFFVLAGANYLFWAMFGSLVGRSLSRENKVILARVFSLLLVGVGFWLFYNNVQSFPAK